MQHLLLPNQTLIEPRFVEIDMMEVVHHSKYWIWFEEARWSFLKDILEVPIKVFRNNDLLMPVIDCNCKYKQSVLWNEPVVLETKLEISEAAHFSFRYKIFSPAEPGRTYTLASTKHAFIGKDFKLKLKVPVLLSESIDKMKHEKPYAFVSDLREGVML